MKLCCLICPFSAIVKDVKGNEFWLCGEAIENNLLDFELSQWTNLPNDWKPNWCPITVAEQKEEAKMVIQEVSKQLAQAIREGRFN